MLRTSFLLTLLLTAMTVTSHAAGQNADEMLAPGVPRALARWRAVHYRDVRYALNVGLWPGADRLKGTEEIRITLDEASDLILDWRVVNPQAQVSNVRDIVVNNRPVADARFTNEHIVIPKSYAVAGENTIKLAFESPVSAAGSAVTRYVDHTDKREYLYTLFVPSDASTAFPCFDQPDLKARFQLSVAAPTAWQVVTNTGAETLMRSGTNSLWRFRATEPLSTYQFAFAAGEFAEFNDTNVVSPNYGRTPRIHLFVRQSQVERARRELGEVFLLNRNGLDFYARYFDYKFPFPKYDLVLIPEFAYGGMEHAGATFLREEGVLFPSDPTANDRAARAELMLHEAAHQWFGDLVTMRWFDDLWLKEGFATFMAYKASERLLPETSAWKVFYQRTKPAAYATDVTRGTTPIFQEIPNLSAAKSAYGNIVCRKAPSLLRQAEFYLGADNFQRAIQLFVKEHAFANAEWGDLVRAFERTSGQKLDEWADAWVKRRGMPDVRAAWQADRRGTVRTFTLTQRDVLDEGGRWPMRLKLMFAYADAPPRTLTVKLDAAPTTEIKEAAGLRAPDWVFANYEDYGYGQFLLDAQSRAHVMAGLGAVRDDFLRALLWGTLWDSVRTAELAPADYIELALRLLPAERDEVIAQSIAGRAAGAFNRYLSTAQQQAVAARLEELFAAQMLRAETQGLRITYFRAFQSVASTDGARAKLKQLLAGQLQVPGMTLRTRDRFDLVTALFTRQDADAPALLARLAAAEKSDDARRYAYAAAAAEASADVKRKYFAAYFHERELPESWIEASAGPFNAPQQSVLTLPYLAPALRALPELKRTRKIFFVNNWLGAFLGGQCSPQAAATVQDFLRRPDLDRDLRLKVLETADALERCVRIRVKFAQDGR